MNAFGIFNISIHTFSLPLIGNWYFDWNGSLTYTLEFQIEGENGVHVEACKLQQKQ